jgi:hypothetical protein
MNASYCELCNQWVTTRGPWCDLYGNEGMRWLRDEDFPSNSNLGMWRRVLCVYPTNVVTKLRGETQ